MHPVIMRQLAADHIKEMHAKAEEECLARQARRARCRAPSTLWGARTVLVIVTWFLGGSLVFVEETAEDRPAPDLFLGEISHGVAGPWWQVPDLLRSPRPVGVGGHAQDVHVAGADLHHELIRTGDGG